MRHVPQYCLSAEFEPQLSVLGYPPNLGRKMRYMPQQWATEQSRTKRNRIWHEASREQDIFFNDSI